MTTEAKTYKRKRPMVINADRLPKDVQYEPPLRIEFGVNNLTCGAEGLTTGRTVVPPGGRNQRHYHHNCEASFYIVSGGLKLYFGADHELQTAECHAGDFVYVPKAEIHGLDNLSETEPCVLIFSYGGVPNKEVAGTIYIEKPWV